MELDNRFGEKNWIQEARENHNQISEDIIFNLVESFHRRIINVFETIELKFLTNG